MSTLIENLTRRINGGIRHDSMMSELSDAITNLNNNTILTTTTNTGQMIGAPSITTGTNTILTTGNGTNTIITTGTTTAGTIYYPQDWTVTRIPTPTYNPYSFSTSGVTYYNIENINIDVLRKFIVNKISFVDDLIDIDDSNTNICKIILSVNKEIYGELEINYIADKIEDYIMEKISGLISCMDPDFNQGVLEIMFIPKSTLLDIINNDNED
jgi:hypothetical protein